MAFNAQALREALHGVPDSAIVYVESEFGNNSEQVHTVCYGLTIDFNPRDCGEPPYYGSPQIEWKEIIQPDDLPKVKAVLITHV